MHGVQAAGTGGRRTTIPSGGQLTPLTELVGSLPNKGARTRMTERDSQPQRDAETDDGCRDFFGRALIGNESVVSDVGARLPSIASGRAVGYPVRTTSGPFVRSVLNA